jgi:multiple sugar transport system permease protein
MATSASNYRAKEKALRILNWVILLIGAIFMVVPFYWMVTTSFKYPSEVIAYPPIWIPTRVTLEHYEKIFTEMNFLRYFFNSAYISITVTAIVILTSAYVGYVFAKFDFWGKNAIFLCILATMMVPFPVTMIPMYLVMSRIGWVGSHKSLIIPALYSTFGIFMMRQFMHSIPNELREAAKIDGCGEFRIFWTIILPLTKSGLAALTIFTFMWNWDNFLWPLIVLNSDNAFTLPVGLAMFANQFWTDYALVLAGSTVTVAPVLLVFFLMQKRFIEGITLSGLKV